MEWLVDSFQRYPELAIFLTLALGYWIGSFKFGNFSLGAVTGVLLAGVLVGQMGITISPHVKAVFFLMFLFAVGYGIGPQFFRGLKSDGVPQAIFAALQSVVALATVFAITKLLGYDAGIAAGLLSGSQTTSPVLGVAIDTINQLDVAADRRTLLANHVPVAYAVTYIFGTAGSAWLLSSLGPKLLGVDLPAACKQLEAKLGAQEAEPGVVSAARRFDVRTYRVTNEELANQTVAAIEERLRDTRTTIERIRRGDAIIDAEPGTIVQVGDVLAMVGPRRALVDGDLVAGPEVHDFELMDFTAAVLDVVVTDKDMAGKTLGQLGESDVSRGVYLRSLVRGGYEMPFATGTAIDRGDVLQIVGSRRNVERVAAELGFADRPSNITDVAFVGAGIVLGGLLGALTIRIGGVPLSLSTNGGTLIAGLVCGWLRSVNRRFGQVPAPALWVLHHVGLAGFIAVVGISAGPSFFAGLRETGLSLLVAGIVSTSLPLIAGVLMGKYVFKFHPAITLGAAAGAQTTTAALPAIQAAAGSKVAALGYTVPFAVSIILITLWGMAIVLLVH